MRVRTRADNRQFYFDRDLVIKATDNATRMVLSKTGALARRRIMNLIKPTRLKNLSEGQRTAYKIRAKAAKLAGRPKPKLPVVHSRPGEPPRSVSGLYKKNVQYDYVHAKKSVKFGMIRLERTSYDVTKVLEFGGQSAYGDRKFRMKPRPHVAIAAKRAQRDMPNLWAEARAKFGAGLTKRIVKKPK